MRLTNRSDYTATFATLVCGGRTGEFLCGQFTSFWSQAVGSYLKNKVKGAEVAEMRFLSRVPGFTLHDWVRSLTIQWSLRLQPLLLQTEWRAADIVWVTLHGCSLVGSRCIRDCPTGWRPAGLGTCGVPLGSIRINQRFLSNQNCESNCSMVQREANFVVQSGQSPLRNIRNIETFNPSLINSSLQ